MFYVTRLHKHMCFCDYMIQLVIGQPKHRNTTWPIICFSVTILPNNMLYFCDQVAQQDSTEATLCCLCCKTGPVSCTFSLEKTGYAPGEDIRVKGEILNLSNRKVASSTAKLMMVRVDTSDIKYIHHVIHFSLGIQISPPPLLLFLVKFYHPRTILSPLPCFLISMKNV